MNLKCYDNNYILNKNLEQYYWELLTYLKTSDRLWN